MFVVIVSQKWRESRYQWEKRRPTSTGGMDVGAQTSQETSNRDEQSFLMALLLQWQLDKNLRNVSPQLPRSPNIIYVKGTWLGTLDYKIKHCFNSRWDRQMDMWMMCRDNIPYRIEGKGEEFVDLKIYTTKGTIKILNFYTSCKRLDINKPKQTQGQSLGYISWKANFKAHITLCGGRKMDVNGKVEELLKEGHLCLNDVRGTKNICFIFLQFLCRFIQVG